MERIAWALIRYRLRSELAIELRICIETLWALPAPSTPFESVVLPSSVLVGLDGTVELGVPYPADQRYFQRYLAPELDSGTATVASAIYAVGALLFEAVSGSPFASSERVAQEVDYLAARARATGLCPDATETRLLEIAARATRQNPQERWATPEIFSRELERASGQRTATREALARLVRGWVRRQRSRMRTPPNAAVWRRASEFPPPSAPLDESAAGQRQKPPSARKDTLRIATLRGYTLDLSSYPPPRPSVGNGPRAPRFEARPELAAATLSAPPSPLPLRDPDPAEVDRGQPLPPPASGPRHTADSTRRAKHHRSAALVTALVVALPLIGMTLWNWRASAHAADHGVPQSQQHIRASVQPPSSVEPVAEPPPRTRVTRGEPRVQGPVPRIDLTKAPAGEPTRAPRRTPQKLPTFKPRGPFDYGI